MERCQWNSAPRRADCYSTMKILSHRLTAFARIQRKKQIPPAKNRLRNDNGRVLPRSDLAATMQRKETALESGAGFFKCVRGDENKNGDSHCESPSREAAEGGSCAAIA